MLKKFKWHACRHIAMTISVFKGAYAQLKIKSVSVTRWRVTCCCKASFAFSRVESELFSLCLVPMCPITIQASFHPLSQPFDLFLSACVRVFVCRSSSPCCCSVGGFHQSKRLWHRQLVSILPRLPACSCALITTQFGCLRLIAASSSH